MIPGTNTVVDPRTMVIKPLDTMVAGATVSTPRCPHYHAIWTHKHRVYELHNLKKVH